ncbi:GATA zinc finger domain-containing protein 4-like isoform X1 [Centruroides vittatus]|uniref:GATA zinc finger domain-containing protein 4-like isoform X1 n=1 Tax=Centruroides vittatus TaxID=120091 RepID=UPI00350F4D32
MKGKLFSKIKKESLSSSNDELLSLSWSCGDRIKWKRNNILEIGTIRWLGYISAISKNLVAGIEFDNPIGYGDGKIGFKRYFYGKNNHVCFIPVDLLNKVDDKFSSDSTFHLLNCQYSTKNIDSGNLEFKKGNKPILSKSQKVKSVHLKHRVPKFGQWSEDEAEENNNRLQNKSYSVESCPEMFSVKYGISSSSESDSDTKSGLQMLMSCFIPSSKYHKRKKIKKINLEHKKILDKYKPVEDINTKIEKKKVPPPIPPPPSPLLLKKQVKSEYYNQLSKSDNNLHKEDTILRNCKSNTLNISKSTDKVNILHSPHLKSKTSSLPMRYQKRRAPPPPINISVCDKEECNKNVENVFKSNLLSLEDKVEPVKEIDKSIFKNIEIVNQVDNPNFRKIEEVLVSPPILPVKKVPHDTKTLFGYSLEEQEQNLSYNKLSQNENSYCDLKQNFIKSPEENINLCCKEKVVNLTDLSRKLFYQSSSYHRTKTKAKNDNSRAKEEKLSSNIMFDRFTNQNKEKEADLYQVNDTMSFTNLFTNHLHSDFNVKTKYGVTKSDDSFKERGNKDSSDSYIRKKICSNNNNKAVLSNTNTIFPFTITSENYVTFSSPEACFVTYSNANENSPTIKHSFVNDKNYLKHESLKESENKCQNKNNYQNSKADAKENIFKEKNKLNNYNIKEEIKSDITKESKLNLLIEKDKTDKDKQPLCNIFLDDSTINQNKEGREFSLQHNYRKKHQIKSDKPLSILEEKQKFVVNEKFNKTSELDTIENNYSMKKCPEKKLNSVHVQTESLFGELGVNVKNSNSGVCSSANFYRPTQEIRTPQTSTTLAVPLPELRANRTYRHDSLHSSNKAMSMSKKFQLITLFKQLETAIASGQHKKAAVLAKKISNT